MSSYTEQDELEQLKAWWKNYGISLVIGVVLGIALLFGYRYWNEQRERQRAEASAIYDRLTSELRSNKTEARATGEKLITEFASTPYAGMAALLLARQAYDAGDKALARQRLEWVLANAKDSATQHAARLRLARVLIEAGEVPAAAALAQVKDITGFESEYYELRGDLALVQGERETARVAYREALKHVTPGSSYASVLTMKLDDLGGDRTP